MATRQHVRSLAPANQAELLGPAEGQYVTTFQDTMEGDCVDAYAFNLVSLTESDTCISIVPASLPPGTTVEIAFYSFVTCEFVDSYLPAPGQVDCYNDLPAGEYIIYVEISSPGGAIPYTLTVETTLPTANSDQVLDEDCGPWVACM